MTNLDSILKSRDVTWPTKVHLVKAMVFPVVMYGCESWTIKKAAAAAKSLQLCPTLCDPIDGSPPGSPVPGILQARTLDWVAISFSNAWKWKVKVKLLSRVRLFTTPRTTAYQAPPSMGFSRQEDWSGMPLSSPILKLFSIKCNYIKRLGIQYIICSLKPYQYINHDKVTLFFKFPSIFVWASLVVQLVKNPPAMQETLGWILGQEVPLEKG